MKSVLSPRSTRRLAPWLVVTLVSMMALPVSANAAPFDPGALLDHLRGLFSSIWSGPVSKSTPPLRNQPVGKAAPCPFDAPGGVCAPLGEHGCEIEPGGICHQ